MYSSWESQYKHTIYTREHQETKQNMDEKLHFQEVEILGVQTRPELIIWYACMHKPQSRLNKIEIASVPVFFSLPSVPVILTFHENSQQQLTAEQQTPGNNNNNNISYVQKQQNNWQQH